MKSHSNMVYYIVHLAEQNAVSPFGLFFEETLLMFGSTKKSGLYTLVSTFNSEENNFDVRFFD